MLRIRKEQYDFLENNMRRRFILDLCSHVRSNFPEESEAYSDDDLEEQIVNDLSIGKEHGLSSEKDLILFADLTWILGKDYLTNKDYKWVQKFLNKESWEPDVRMAFIYRRLVDEENEKENKST